MTLLSMIKWGIILTKSLWIPKKIISSIGSIDRRKSIMIIIVIGIVLHGLFIAVDLLITDAYLSATDGSRNLDTDLYIGRAETILNGNLLYRDVETQTPPLINYFMAIPVSMGASLLAFEIFFSIFNVLTAVLLYHTFSRFDSKKAFYISIIFLMIPHTFSSATFGRQDECLITFIFLIPLCLSISCKSTMSRNISAGIIGMGIWIKMYSLLLVPGLIITGRTNKERGGHVGIIAAISALVSIPFLVLCWSEFTWFLKFYFLGNQSLERKGLEGISLWRYLEVAGITVPQMILIGFLGITHLLLYYYSYRKKYSAWRIATLSFLIFFFLYPKIHFAYFMMLFALLLPYTFEKQGTARLFLFLVLTTCLVTLVEYSFNTRTFITISSSLLLSGLTMYILAYLFYKIINSSSFFEIDN